MTERSCVKNQCIYYKRNNLSPIGIMNCKATAWVCSHYLSCPYYMYANQFDSTFENPNGTYTPDSDNSP